MQGSLNKRVLRRPSVQDMTGLGRSTLYEMMARGDFPKPVRIGARAVGWRESDIVAWLDSRKPSDVG
jgi:prophage regulatory protein